MSSKRKRHQGENNGSNRNLDGRRLRVVSEAKSLAEYLALKPEMDQREKSERRKRQEKIIQLAEKRMADTMNDSKGRIDGKWIDEKEEAAERTREAVLVAMRSANYKDIMLGTSSGDSRMTSGRAAGDEDVEEIDMENAGLTAAKEFSAKAAPPLSYFGFDDDDEYISVDEDGEENKGNEIRMERGS